MFTAIAFFAKGVFSVLAKVPWYVWPMVVLLWWGAAGRLALTNERADRAKEQKAQAAAIAKSQAEALATESTWKGRVYEQHRAKEIEVANIAAARDAALAGLRNRAPRRTDVPGAPATACPGATGADLSERDAGDLVRLAARADRLRAALGECQAWIETVTKPKE